MAIFSSRPPFNDDPKPWVDREDGPANEIRQAHPDAWTLFEPRPEFDRPQNNPTNPILVEARARGDYTVMLSQIDAGGFARIANSDQRVHARRVLSRLARFKEESA